MTKLDNLSSEILNRFGPITRARNCFLYTKKGIRLTDLFQENGRAILGWDESNAYTFFKNTLNKGLNGSFICETESRLRKAVSLLLASSRKLYYFSSKKDALETALLFAKESTSIWKPWNDSLVPFSSIKSVIIAPPLPWTDTFYILAIDEETWSSNKDLELLIKNKIKLPYSLEVAITRSIYDLLKAIQERKESEWFIYDSIITNYWSRKGPYLYPKMDETKYEDFVIHCLSCNLVINPDYNNPSIVPFGADKGVFTKLKNNPFTF
jgi:hypothetical protein